MRIIGNGFIAFHLRQIADRHDDVVALAAGVSYPSNPVESYERERALVEAVVADCLADGRKLVFMSSAAVYGRTGDGREDAPTDPPTDYGRHKASLEALIRDSGVRHVSLRLGYILGRHAPPHRLVPSLIRQIGEGTVTLHRHAYRDLVHVRDMVTVIAGLLDVGTENEVVNVASGTCMPIARIVRHIERRLDRRATWRLLDEGARHCMANDRMLSLMPPGVSLEFPPTYWRSVIDSYLEDTGVVAAPEARARTGAAARG
jgi:nucleoside-diphosphate-sugar epimerase